MSETAVLEAQQRSDKGKKATKQLRREGFVPAVLYGYEIDTVSCTVNGRTFEHLLSEHGRNAIVSLRVGANGGPEHSTIVKEIQHHPVTGEVLHIDFQRISMTETLVVEVAVHGEGVPSGVKNEGGILEQMLHTVEVECLPSNIPDELTYDVSALEIGDTIHVSDLTSPEGTTFVTEGERSVFAVVPPTVVPEDEEDEEAVEDEEMLEPELVDERGKKDEDEDESEAAEEGEEG